MASFGFQVEKASARDKTTGAAASGSAIPITLVGTWRFAAATGNYCDHVGHCAPGSGGSISFTFGPDGRAEYALFQAEWVNGCGQIQTLARKIGTVAVRGSTIHFSPKTGTYKAINGCRPDLTGTWNFEVKDLTPMSLGWLFVPDANKPSQNALKLLDPKNEASGIYSRR